ncbi:hypothetical protein [Nocardia abscessus]|uniref:hypothetical protein n=1 Tax=Nocardia abscessus TaxID=120957 RepID=UPI0024577398|nr:hypothetical protein [Nocardia abscessus]
MASGDVVWLPLSVGGPGSGITVLVLLSGELSASDGVEVPSALAGVAAGVCGSGLFEVESVLPTAAGPEFSLPTSLVGAVAFCGCAEFIEAGVVFSVGFDVTESLSVSSASAGVLAGWVASGCG